MNRLSAWLCLQAPHHPDEDGTRILAASRALNRELRSRGVTMLIGDDPWFFRDKVEFEFRRQLMGGAPLPLLASHADPVARTMNHNFVGIIGTERKIPMPLLMTSTGSVYRNTTVYDLFTSQRLWCDEEEDAPYHSVKVTRNDPWLRLTSDFIHGGTTWVRPDKQGHGLGNLLARLWVMVLWLRFGDHPIIGTTVAGKGHERVFNSPRTIGEAVCDQMVTNINLYLKEDLLADAEKVLAPEYEQTIPA